MWLCQPHIILQDILDQTVVSLWLRLVLSIRGIFAIWDPVYSGPIRSLSSKVFWMLRVRVVDLSSLHLLETKPKIIPAWMSRVLRSIYIVSTERGHLYHHNFDICLTHYYWTNIITDISKTLEVGIKILETFFSILWIFFFWIWPKSTLKLMAWRRNCPYLEDHPS